MDACHVLLGRPWHFDRYAINECKRNIYSFEMSGKKHSLHIFRGTQEEVSKQLPMMANKKFVEYSKVEVEVKVISQEILSNDFEVEMTNQVCNDWLNKGKDQ